MKKRYALIALLPEELSYVYIIPPASSGTVGFYDAAGEEMQFR